MRNPICCCIVLASENMDYRRKRTSFLSTVPEPFRTFLQNGPAIQTPLEPPEEQRRRFEIECEFVQSLANPNYLNFLAQRGYFKEEYFVNYLKYLLYWKRPEYARALTYPQCLFMLEAIQEEDFRKNIESAASAKFIEDQQVLQWQYYLRKRMRLHENVPSQSENTDKEKEQTSAA